MKVSLNLSTLHSCGCLGVVPAISASPLFSQAFCHFLKLALQLHLESVLWFSWEIQQAVKIMNVGVRSSASMEMAAF